MAKYIAGTGRRKTAVALVRLTTGSGKHSVNGKELNTYFGLASWQARALAPLTLLSRVDQYDLSVKVVGGGPSSQADAVRLGIARALIGDNEELRGTLKKEGYLTRDARTKERRKYGLKKARKAPQFSKR